MKARVIIFGLAAVGFLLYKVFFVDSGEVRNFNDTLVDIVLASDSNFDPYLEFLNQYAEGETVDVSLMTQTRNDLKATIEGDIKTLKEIKVPDDELCKDFHRHCLGYMTNSSAIVDAYEKQVDFISKNNPGKEQDMVVLGGITADLLVKDQELFETVADVQAKMADKFDFELE